MKAARKEDRFAIVSSFKKLIVEHPTDENKQQVFQADLGSKEIKLVRTRDRQMIMREDSIEEKEEEDEENSQSYVHWDIW